MNRHALVVEDDPGVIPTVDDMLYSMGHRHTWVTNQRDAQEVLASEKFDYVLLDLAIPARPNGEADKQFGINLLDYISQGCQLPVIIMTAFLAECVDLGNQLRELGARDCIAKPFQNRGRELVKKIRKLLGKSNPTVDRPAKVSQPVTTTANRFEGGDLVFFDDRVELLGVKIITDRGTGQTMMVLDQLRRKDSRGRYVCRSGEDLARLIDAPGGANAVATFVHTLRTNITQRLRRQCGIEAGPEDVIAHNEQGYFLKDGIVTSDAGETTEAEAKAGPSSDDVAVRLNARQAWILSEVQRGGRLKRATVEKRFHVTSKTAQRDLGELARAGRIEFVRTGRAGYYRAVELQLAERA